MTTTNSKTQISAPFDTTFPAERRPPTFAAIQAARLKQKSLAALPDKGELTVSDDESCGKVVIPMRRLPTPRKKLSDMRRTDAEISGFLGESDSPK